MQARALSGHQIDNIATNRLTSALGSRWLMSAQECRYRPPRAAARAVSAEAGALDVALLMVDNRLPLPYEVARTTLRSPDTWGTPRITISDSWTPLRGSVSSFQLALMINHIYAQLHGYRFYLENPCPSTVIGVTEDVWNGSVPGMLFSPLTHSDTAETQTGSSCSGVSAHAHHGLTCTLTGRRQPIPRSWAACRPACVLCACCVRAVDAAALPPPPLPSRSDAISHRFRRDLKVPETGRGLSWAAVVTPPRPLPSQGLPVVQTRR